MPIIKNQDTHGETAVCPVCKGSFVDIGDGCPWDTLDSNTLFQAMDIYESGQDVAWANAVMAHFNDNIVNVA